MLKNISQILVGLSIFSPVILTAQLFFPFISGKALFFRVVIELAVLSYALHILFSSKRKEEFKKFVQGLKNPIVICSTIFLLIFILASFTAVNPTQSFWSNFERSDGGFQLIHYYAFFILLVSIFRKKKDFEKILLSAIITSSYVATYGVLQWLKLDPSFHIIGDPIRISGTLGNASYLAALMLFAIGFLLYFIIRFKNKWFQIPGALLAIFFTIILFKTGTRGALLALFLAGLSFAIANIFRKDSTKWFKRASIAIILVSIIFSGIFLATNKNSFWSQVPVINRQLQLDKAIDEVQPRIWSWTSALKGFQEKPILGWGPENYPFVYDKYYDARNFGRESFFDRVHNLYLEHLVSGGILLFLSALLVFIFLFKKIFQKKKDLWFSILLAIPIAYAVQAFFLFDVLVIYLCFYLLLALTVNKEIDSNHIALKLNNLQIGIILSVSLFLLINTLFIQNYHLTIPLLIALAISIFYKKSEHKYLASLTDFSFSLIGLLLITGLIYASSYQPFQKNMALAKTFTTNSVGEKLSYFKNALDLRSPIGQEEVAGSLDSFLLGLSEQLAQRLELVDISSLEEIVNFSNITHDQYRHLFPGLRHDYTNGAYNVRLGLIYNQPQLLERGKRIYYSALEESPTRIEFLILLIDVARIEGNKQEYERLRRWAIDLRPDLSTDWPPIPN